MSSARLIAVADAVVAAITDSGIAPQQYYVVRRQNVPRLPLEKLSDDQRSIGSGAIHITVTPKNKVTARVARGMMIDEITIYVGIQQQCRDFENRVSDPLIELGESIQRYFDQGLPLTCGLTNPTATFAATCKQTAFGADGDSPWMSPQEQNSIQVYTGIVVLTFETLRASGT